VPCILISFRIEWFDLTMYCAYSLLSRNYELTILKYKFSTFINNEIEQNIDRSCAPSYKRSRRSVLFVMSECRRRTEAVRKWPVLNEHEFPNI